MTTKEAIGVLECMAVDMTGAMAGLSERNPMTDVLRQRLDAINAAQDALRAQLEFKPVEFDRFKNEPLTLDELRKMDNEPVWIVEYPDWGCWELSNDAEDYLEDRDPAFYGMTHNDPDGRNGLHKLGWLAYRHKPREG